MAGQPLRIVGAAQGSHSSNESHLNSPWRKLNTVLVSNVENFADVRVLQSYFEDKSRSGGGPVQKIVMLQESTSCCTAVIYFLCYEDAWNVIHRNDHRIMHRKISAFLYDEQQKSVYSCQLRAAATEVLLVGLHDSVTDGDLKVWFQSPESDFATATEKYDETSAIVRFAEFGNASTLLRQSPFNLNIPSEPTSAYRVHAFFLRDLDSQYVTTAHTESVVPMTHDVSTSPPGVPSVYQSPVASPCNTHVLQEPQTQQVNTGKIGAKESQTDVGQLANSLRRAVMQDGVPVQHTMQAVAAASSLPSPSHQTQPMRPVQQQQVPYHPETFPTGSAEVHQHGQSQGNPSLVKEIQPLLADYEARVQALFQTEVNRVHDSWRADISQLEGRMQTLLKELLEREVTQLKTRLESDVVDMETRVQNQLQVQSRSDLQTQFRTEMSQLQTRLESDVNQMKTRLEAQLQTQVQSDIQQMQNRLEAAKEDCVNKHEQTQASVGVQNRLLNRLLVEGLLHMGSEMVTMLGPSRNSLTQLDPQSGQLQSSSVTQAVSPQDQHSPEYEDGRVEVANPSTSASSSYSSSGHL